MNKNSQIMIFIIFAVVVLIVSIFLIVILDVEIFTTKQNELTGIINDKISRCIKNDLNNAVNVLGLMGGHIYLPENIENHPNLYNEKYVDLGVKVLNWHENNIPTISSMEDEITKYLLENSRGCIENSIEDLDYLNFESFKDFEVQTFINDFSVLAQVKFPLNFNEVGSSEIYSVEDFEVELLGSPIGAMYELSAKIYNKNQQESFLENLIIDQILSASDYSSHNSFPTEGMLFSCDKRVWTMSNLRRNLARMNNANFKFLQIENTYSKDYLKNLFLDDTTRNYYDNFYSIDVLAKDSDKDFLVEVFMPSVEITENQGFVKSYPFRKFEISPSDGEIVKAKDFNIRSLGSVKVPCIQIFGHKYNLDYDLVVKITDRDRKYDGYFFNFPIRVQIENTFPKKSVPKLLGAGLEPLTTNNYCLDENRVNNIRISAIADNENYLDKATFKYSCLTNTCHIENKTQKETFNGVEIFSSKPSLTTKLPYCIGGVLEGEKEGYFSKPQRIDTIYSEENEDLQAVDINFYELKEYEISKDNFLLVNNGVGTYLKDTMSAYIEIENENLGFSSQGAYPSDFEDFSKIEILREPKKYNISVYIMEDGNLVGFLEIKDMLIDTSKGNRIDVKLNSLEQGLEDEKYIEYYEDMLEKTKTGRYYFKIS